MRCRINMIEVVLEVSDTRSPTFPPKHPTTNCSDCAYIGTAYICRFWTIKCGRSTRTFLALLLFLPLLIFLIKGPFRAIVDSPLLERYVEERQINVSETVSWNCKGNLFHKVHEAWSNVSDVTAPVSIPKDDVSEILCRDYVTSGYTDFAVLSAFYDGSVVSRTDVVTFVTQLSFSRFERLEAVLRNWKGPVSAAIYVSPAEYGDFIRTVCHSYEVQSRNNVGIHMVLEAGMYYPINILRNIALKGANTELVYLSDVDFIPSPGSVEEIQAIMAGNSTFFSKTVLVIPAFEVMQENFDSRDSPLTKAQLRYFLNSKSTILPARQTKWPHGHMPTRYDKWVYASETYQIHYKNEYEPYIVMNRTLTPPYCDQFVERQRDKAAHLMEVWAAGFEFRVAPQSFSLHLPHPYTKAARRPSVHTCALKLYDKFVHQLQEKYHFANTPGRDNITTWNHLYRRESTRRKSLLHQEIPGDHIDPMIK